VFDTSVATVTAMDTHTMLRQRRLAIGVCQADLAISVGIARSKLSAIETGACSASDTMYDQLFEALAVTPRKLLALHRDEVIAICERHHLVNAKVFGSVARGTDDIASNLDLLVDSMNHSLMDIAGAQLEIESLLGVDTDIITTGGLDPDRHDDIINDATHV
jgi:uncharacterized protein